MSHTMWHLGLGEHCPRTSWASDRGWQAIISLNSTCFVGFIINSIITSSCSTHELLLFLFYFFFSFLPSHFSFPSHFGGNKHLCWARLWAMPCRAESRAHRFQLLLQHSILTQPAWGDPWSWEVLHVFVGVQDTMGRVMVPGAAHRPLAVKVQLQGLARNMAGYARNS